MCYPMQVGLEALANHHGLRPRRLHNGGNDAYFTLAVMLRQACHPGCHPVFHPKGLIQCVVP